MPTVGRLFGRKRKKPAGNEPNFNLRLYLYQMAGVDLTQIDGINVLTVQKVLSETSVDMKSRHKPLLAQVGTFWIPHIAPPAPENVSIEPNPGSDSPFFPSGFPRPSLRDDMFLGRWQR